MSWRRAIQSLPVSAAVDGAVYATAVGRPGGGPVGNVESGSRLSSFSIRRLVAARGFSLPREKGRLWAMVRSMVAVAAVDDDEKCSSEQREITKRLRAAGKRID